jgi:hypothetical protein
MTSVASTTTWETLVEQYRERAARDDARIEELRQSTEHWHYTADMLKRQRDMAEQERDALRKDADIVRRAKGRSSFVIEVTPELLTKDAFTDQPLHVMLTDNGDGTHLLTFRESEELHILRSRLTAFEKKCEALRKAIATMEELAREAYAHWDNDADSKVGKCLVALSGATGLRRDLDPARDAAWGVQL